MVEFLSTLQLEQVGYAGLTAFAIFSLFKGWIVPRFVLTEVRADRDKRIEEITGERNDWKTAYFKSEDARHVLVAQNGELLALAKVSAHVLDSLPRVESDKDGVA